MERKTPRYKGERYILVVTFVYRFKDVQIGLKII